MFPSTLVTKIESVKQFDALLKEKNKLPTAVLFSTKSTISLVYRSIAYALKDRMNLVFSSVKGDLALSHEIVEPKLGVFDVDGRSAKWYDGSDMNSRKELAAWLTIHAKEEQRVDDGSNDDVLEANSDGQTVFNASTFQLDAISIDEAWLVAVVDSKDNRPDKWTAAMKGCVGRIKCAVLVCDHDSTTSSATPDESSSDVDATTVTFGQKTCQGLQGMLPRYLAVRHGAPARKKLRETGTDKWGSSVLSEAVDHKKVQKFLGESLPETAVIPVTEYNMWQFVTAGTMLGKVSIVLVSNNDQVPGLYRNLALSMGEQAQYGYMDMPSPDFVKGKNTDDDAKQVNMFVLTRITTLFFSHLTIILLLLLLLTAIGGKVPAIIAIPSPGSSEEAEKKGVQIVNYNPELLGPFNYAGLSQFVQGVYRAFEHTFTEVQSEQPKKSDPKIVYEEPPPVVDEGPIIADSEESKDEAEAFLREIQLEEEAKAAKLKEEEMKEEEERRKAEEGNKKKKKKKGKKGKKSKGKEEL